MGMYVSMLLSLFIPPSPSPSPHPVSIICKIDASGNLLSDSANSNWDSLKVGWDGRWEGGSRGRHVCIPRADSCCRVAERNTVLQSNYPSMENRFLKWV